MNIEHANADLFAALAKAQTEIENASKKSSNPHFRSKYADLAEVLNTVRPVLAKHGISILQSTEFDGARVSVTTMLAHGGGGSVSSTASCVPAKTDAQGVGSATTYLRRYSLAAMCGIAQEDDDGNAAAHNEKPEPTGKPMDGTLDHFDPEEICFLRLKAAEIIDAHNINGGESAAKYIYKKLKLDQEKLLGVWNFLPSDVRRAVKEHKDKFIEKTV